MEIWIVLLIGTPLVVGIWLVFRALVDGAKITELTRRVDNLQDQLFCLRNHPPQPPTAAPRTQTVAATPPPPPVTPEPAPIFPVSPPPIAAEPPFRPAVIPALRPPPEPVTAQVRLPEPPLPTKSPEPAFIPPARIPVLPLPADLPPITSTARPEKGAFEMRLGTYWLVRVGIVMLLTGLAFFGNYAYHNIIGKLGPAGKISLLYTFSALLLGAGAWWQRRPVKESLKNYGQVLFAGGLAAVYFTTYAAHHIPPLQVIGSAVLDGMLLLLWAGVIAWLADRRKSEVMALFAIGLAFYSSVITRVGDFTLWSNLVLTLAAVGFLLRNRWATLSFVGMVTSYAGYAFWRFLHEDGWHWAAPDERLAYGAAFLAAYWLVFTCATFLSRSDKLAGVTRATFLTLNNGAFFALFLLTMLQVHNGGFWKFSLIDGTVLLGLAGLARLRLPEEKPPQAAYLVQGLLLVTLGFITKFSGLQLALVLGVESVTLYVLGSQRQSRLIQGFGGAVAILATGWDVVSLKNFDTHGLWTGISLGGLMTVNTVWAHRREAVKELSRFRRIPAAFTVLALANWLAVTWFNTTLTDLPLALAAEAIALTLSIYVLKVPEIPVLGQVFLILAQLAALSRLSDNTPMPPWWNPLSVILVTVGLSHWWQKQKRFAAGERFSLGCQAIFAVAVVALVLVWSHPAMSAANWLALTALLALAATFYGVATRAWPLAVFGQVFLVASVWQFLVQAWMDKPEWYFPLVPIAALAMLAFAAGQWFRRRPDAAGRISQPVLKVALVYRWAALLLSLCWLWQYVPNHEHVWAFMAVAAAFFGFAVWKRQVEVLLGSGVYAGVALFALWSQNDLWAMDVYWANAVSLLALFLLQQVLRRRPFGLECEENLHATIVGIAGLSLWRWVTCWAATYPGGFFLTMAWAGLAVFIFVGGMLLRERFHRWLGLGLLAAAVGRVVLVDVWKEETIYRVLTFMALGAALLVIGFLYNKYQDKIRTWL